MKKIEAQHIIQLAASLAVAFGTAAAAQTLRLIPVHEIDFLRADSKYTLVSWRDGDAPAEALVTLPVSRSFLHLFRQM